MFERVSKFEGRCQGKVESSAFEQSRKFRFGLPIENTHDRFWIPEMGQQLGTLVGLLSDGAVHFTPEFFSRLDFQEQDGGKMMFSEYLETDDEEISHYLRMLGSVHLLILKTLDRCCDEGFSAIPGFSVALERIITAGLAIFAKYPYPLQPELEQQLGSINATGVR